MCRDEGRVEVQTLDKEFRKKYLHSTLFDPDPVEDRGFALDTSKSVFAHHCYLHRKMRDSIRLTIHNVALKYAIFDTESNRIAAMYQPGIN